MRAGDLDRLVTLQSAAANSSDWNDPRDVSWSDLNTDPNVWAKKMPESGSEGGESGKETARSVVVWQLRHRTDLTEDMRLQHDSKNYYITDIQEIGRGEGLEIVTEYRR